jgi:hypothetical protein
MYDTFINYFTLPGGLLMAWVCVKCWRAEEIAISGDTGPAVWIFRKKEKPVRYWIAQTFISLAALLVIGVGIARLIFHLR